METGLAIKPIPAGIDVGTNHTVLTIIPDGSQLPVTIKARNGSALHCSAIYYNPDSTLPNLYGQAALDMIPSKNVITCPKRAIAVTSANILANKMELSFNATMSTTGQNHAKFSVEIDRQQVSVSPSQIISELLAYYKSLIEAEAGHSSVEYVVSMPEFWGLNQNKILLKSLKTAGITPKQLITEPAAAQFAYKANQTYKKSKFLVIDLGDGTLDISLMTETARGVYKTIAVGGNTCLGSRDVDHLLLDALESEMAQDPTFKLNSFQDQVPSLLIRLKILNVIYNATKCICLPCERYGRTEGAQIIGLASVGFCPAGGPTF